jgi:DNA-binding transcriptional regulator GbsR (MarR family)
MPNCHEYRQPGQAIAVAASQGQPALRGFADLTVLIIALAWNKNTCALEDINVISEQTEIKELDMRSLTPIQQKFILHWGEMGTRWGINRTVAQIHALLYLSPQPLHAEDIAETLGVARSNVSTSLKELQGWGIVKLVHVLGDKRDHFESMKDVWEMFRVVLDERKRREIDPTLAMIRDCIGQAHNDKQTDEYTQERLRELVEFFQTTTAWYSQVRSWPTGALARFVKLGDKIRKMLGAEAKPELVDR